MASFVAPLTALDIAPSGIPSGSFFQSSVGVPTCNITGHINFTIKDSILLYTSHLLDLFLQLFHPVSIMNVTLKIIKVDFKNCYNTEVRIIGLSAREVSKMVCVASELPFYKHKVLLHCMHTVH